MTCHMIQSRMMEITSAPQNWPALSWKITPKSETLLEQDTVDINISHVAY